MGLVKIQSISDIITNSSTEIFCIKTTDNFKSFFKGFEKYFDCIFFTFDDVKKYITSKMWYDLEELDDVLEYNPLSDYNIQEAAEKAGKTKEQLFDFFQECYKPLIGYALYSFQDDCGTCWNKLEEYVNQNYNKDGEDIKTYRA